MTRYCVISDGDSRRYLCPADRREEAVRRLAEIQQFWMNRTVSTRDTFEVLTPPSVPTYLVQLEGELLTFEAPQINGRPVS